MLDDLGVLISSVVMFLVIFRATRLDTLQPWFGSPKAAIDNSGLKLRSNNSGGDGRVAPREVRHDG